MATLKGWTPRAESITWRHVTALDGFGKPKTYTDTTIEVNWSGKKKRLKIESQNGEIRYILSSAAVITVDDLAIDDILIRSGVNHIVIDVQEVQDDNGQLIERVAYV